LRAAPFRGRGGHSFGQPYPVLIFKPYLAFL
jgi:hypothetical protein